MKEIGGLGSCSLQREMHSLAGGGRFTFSLIQENPTGNVDTELRLSTGVSRMSCLYFPQFGQVVLDDGVDTTLSLFSRRSALLGWSRPDFFGVDDEKEVQLDLTLSLDLPGSRSTAVSKGKRRNDDDQNQVADVVYNPTPLRWFWPDCDCVGSSTGPDQNQNLVDTIALIPKALGATVKKKRRRGKAQGGGDQRPKRRKSATDDENQRPLVPIEEIPGLFQTLELRCGRGPVFLYRKKLEGSDVQKEKNRLFVTRGERVMEFLREEEAAEVNNVKGEGIKIVGIDGGGKVYEKMGIKKWESLQLIVIKSDWKKVVAENHAEKGDVVEIWGYRENEEPCLAFNFRREREIGGGAAASSSGSNE